MGSEDSSAEVAGLRTDGRRDLNWGAWLVFLSLSEDVVLDDCSLASVSSACNKECEGTKFDELFHCVV